VVDGEWQDLYPSALVSVDVIEAAVLGHETGKDEDGRDWERVRVVTIDDEKGELFAERLTSTEDGAGPIRLTARIGLFGNPEREERLVRAVADRLRELKGREWAPIK
jgi:hypothetical protein